MQQRTRQLGFSLLELSIALVILSLLSYTLVSAVGIGRNYDHYTENRVYMQTIQKALLTFVQANGYLPCPDTDSAPDGVENRTGNICNNKNGYLPYKMLGVKSKDAWNQPFYYAINAQADTLNTVNITDPTESASYFNNVSAPVFTTSTKPYGTVGGSGNINICGENTVGGCAGTSNGTAGDKIERRAIAVVISFGKNGAETWSRFPISGGAYTLAEDENIDGDEFYWKAIGSNVSGQEYDDQLIWVTGYDVKYALIRSERGLQ